MLCVQLKPLQLKSYLVRASFIFKVDNNSLLMVRKMIWKYSFIQKKKMEIFNILIIKVSASI